MDPPWLVYLTTVSGLCNWALCTASVYCIYGFCVRPIPRLDGFLTVTVVSHAALFQLEMAVKLERGVSKKWRGMFLRNWRPLSRGMIRPL